MCDPRFIRISMLEGRLAGEIIITLEAPEQIDGFIEQAMRLVCCNLGVNPDDVLRKKGTLKHG